MPIAKIIILIILFVVLRIITDNYINSNKISKNEISDISHKCLPDLSGNRIIKNAYDLFSSIPTIALLYKIYSSGRWDLLNSFLIIIILANILRCIFYSVTILPDPIKCTKTDKTFLDKLHNFFAGTCRDKIFSGHIINSYIPLMFLVEYYSMNRGYLYGYQIVLVILMLLQRLHYTIDALVAYFVANYIYYNKDSIITSLF